MKQFFSSPCWTEDRCVGNHGYTVLSLKGKTKLAHRIAYEILIGEIPKGLQLDHLCRNKRCYNPAHLEVVSNRENVVRGTAGDIQKSRTHCPQGHEYKGYNLILYHNRRYCRTCTNERTKKYRRNRRAK